MSLATAVVFFFSRMQLLVAQQRQPRIEEERTALFEEVQQTVEATQSELMNLKRKLREQKDRHHDEKLALLAAMEAQVACCLLISIIIFLTFSCVFASEAKDRNATRCRYCSRAQRVGTGAITFARCCGRERAGSRTCSARDAATPVTVC